MITPNIDITLAQPGFAGRHPKWRIVLYTDECPIEAIQNGTTRAGRNALAENVMYITYLRGNKAFVERRGRELAQRWITTGIERWR